MRRVPRACLVALLASAVARDALAAHRAKVVVLDDGVKVARDAATPEEDGPWGDGTIELFALRGETVALQVVVEAGDATVDDVRTLVGSFTAEGAPKLDADVTQFVERFIVVERPSGNDREPGSLAFTVSGAPRGSFVGAIADPLVPVAYETARAEPHQRAAVWIDIDVPDDARPATYRSALLVRDARGELAARDIELRVLDVLLPYAAAPVFTYYDTRELRRRMGDARAEVDLRALLHAHRVAAIHDLGKLELGDKRILDLDRAALLGRSYALADGYRGAGAGVGEGVLALGAYGSLGAPSASAAETVSELERALLDDSGDASGVRAQTASFVYAVDEECDSDWPAGWASLVRASRALAGVRVGATCGDDPSGQAADLVMQAAADFDPSRARVAREAHDKWVWAYNGRRPWAGPMMLDVPATDLRANAWIAMRYDVPRWFYWESTFWYDANRGGHGRERGFDPFVVAETFHNADGDHANGDGILVYPGTQRGGVTDYGVFTVFPSVRLKNLRRGIEDAGYIALAREVDAARTGEVVSRIVPRALAFAGARVAWPERARSWLEARRELERILERGSDGHTGNSERVSDGCSIATCVGVASARPWGALFLLCSFLSRAILRGRFIGGRRAPECSTTHGDQARERP